MEIIFKNMNVLTALGGVFIDIPLCFYFTKLPALLHVPSFLTHRKLCLIFKHAHNEMCGRRRQ